MTPESPVSGRSALVVAESVPPAELRAGLAGLGLQVRHAAPAELSARPALLHGHAVVLISAALGLQRVATLSRRLTARGVRPPVLVFADGDPAALEACARGGFDYVAPPYLPGLLRSRVSSAKERHDLARVVEAMATEATLLAYERDLVSARQLQTSLLPVPMPVPDGWDAAVRYRPAGEVAGDFYDCFDLLHGLRLGFVVADVCDKGLSAALFMALIRTLLRHTAEHAGAWEPAGGLTGGRWPDRTARPPATGVSLGAGPLLQAVTATNRYLTRNHLREGYFVTLFFGVLDPVTGALLYVNGGHNPPLLRRASGRLESLPASGPALGMVTDAAYSVRMLRLDPGDTLFAYTDGVVEARSPGGRLFGTDRLRRIVEAPVASADALLSTVDHEVAAHADGAAQADDITMLALRLPESRP
ncbi:MULTISPECIES: PP2C family protein-serine/threonine phosphatase [Catenuloplanes]|uniref:Serine phosphatase RsbU (Regulator of sigma subunit) n=1 Tax=Catenuloplanes niger TaxID=587534 RepID=A0AAE4CXK0_9ACTN|nr:SpoIIE family protein phosphatase [Catenuloplanes niger]MDR7327567.1 serine phosphatase RsbU (regulator of sigma subunit) [Catenuloplanes niger]